MSPKTRRLLALIGSLPIYWALACGALWWFYDIGRLTRGGYFSIGQAISRVIEMGLVVTALTFATWIWSLWAAQKRTLLRLWWGAAWKTMLILFLYLSAVLLRREMWSQRQGANDDVMFLPFVGHINAVFLSELHWLSFLLQVIPCMGIASGILFYFQERLAKSDSARSGEIEGQEGRGHV